MSRPVQEPKVTLKPDKHSDAKVEHPAFGQIGAARVEGGCYLYGSDFRHSRSIRIRINHSELNRSLSRDWPFARKQIIEVELSEAQWATFVSSLNVGEGVQCTIRSMPGEYLVPGLPEAENRVKQFATEVKETVKDAIAHLDGLLKRVHEMGLPVKKAEAVANAVAMAKQEINANLPFVAETFDKHMETTVEKAKTEVNAYAQHVIVSSGLQQLAKLNSLGDAQPVLEYQPTPKE